MPKVKYITEEECIESGICLPVKRLCFTDYVDKPDELRKVIEDYCVDQGMPLVIEKIDQSNNWDKDLFHIRQMETLSENIGKEHQFYYNSSSNNNNNNNKCI
jgi:hypothetical protein